MEIGTTLPIWSIIPFVGMLLSIAIFPIVKGEWWESHQLHVAAFWSLLFLVPFAVAYGVGEATYELAEVVIVDYIPFVVLLFGLYVAAGGIHIAGSIVGTTRNNVVMLGIGMVLASFIGTTGAAMTLIRPVLRANLWRKYKAHIVVFFIFTVANIGGCLTPLGDPPLFLGYLRGVPFFWPLEHLWPLWLFNAVVLLAVFALIDHHYIKKEGKEGAQAMALMDEADERTPIKIEGKRNIACIALIIVAVILNGSIPQSGLFTDAATGLTYGFYVLGDIHIGIEYIVQVGLILIAAAISMKITPKDYRESNHFEWGSIAEVARLFIGIFITMIPALALLRAHGAALGIDQPWEFFWATGALSSFLDNSPTYLVFMTTAGSIGAEAGMAAFQTSVGTIAIESLIAVSAGAVFMGANTYIGNAPNFMVKSIAERAKVKMPTFFGYMGWSCAILIPLFIVDMVVFFVL